MILVTDLTSYAEIRAVIGVDSTELTDTTLALPLYAIKLQKSLRDFQDADGKTLQTYYEEIDPASMTEAQENLYYSVRQYATYVVALAACSGLSMFALKSDSDGKASQSRFSSEATFKDVVAAISMNITALTSSLNEMLGEESSYVYPVFSAVQPDTDRVTNE